MRLAAMTERSNNTDITEQLIEAATTGDREAVRRILTVIQPLVARYCRARLPGHRADDATQDVCLAILQALPRYQPRAAFLGWVYRIAHNKITDDYRAAAKVEPMSTVPELTPAAGLPITPEAALLASEDKTAALTALGELTERQREVITLRVMWGMCTDEIAEALGIRPTAIRIAQHRGLAALRRKLGVNP